MRFGNVESEKTEGGSSKMEFLCHGNGLCDGAWLLQVKIHGWERDLSAPNWGDYCNLIG